MRLRDNTTRVSKSKPSSVYLGGIAFGLVLGIGLGIILALGPQAVLSEFSLSTPELIIGGMATLTGLSSAFLALLALSEQRLMRQAGTDPELVAHFDQREDAAELVVLKIVNVGAGAALKVQVKLVSDEVGFDKGIFNRAHLNKNPLRTIPQGDSVSFNFGRGFELLEEPRPKPLEVNLIYENIEGTEAQRAFVLDVREMALMPSHQSLEKRQTDATEAIAENLKGTSTKLDSLLVEVTEMRANFRNWQKNE